MKKLISLLLVLTLVVAMAAPVMAVNVPGSESYSGELGGYGYDCSANVTISRADASIAYSKNTTNLSIAVTLDRTQRGYNTQSVYSDGNTGRSYVTYSYNNANYVINSASFTFRVGTTKVYSPYFN